MIGKLYALKESYGYISYENGQEINRFLAKMTINDLPLDQLSNIEDYLINALNCDAVSYEYRESLDALLKGIQNKK